MIVVGLEDGALEVYEYDSKKNELSLLEKPHVFNGHVDAITRIKFRKNHKSLESKRFLQFASCSLDHTVRVFNFYLNW